MFSWMFYNLFKAKNLLKKKGVFGKTSQDITIVQKQILRNFH
jgi:hypothetical protein